MNLLRYLVLFSLTGLSHAATCAIHTFVGSAPGPMMEICDYERDSTLVLTCRATEMDKTTAHCKDVIDAGGDICAAKVTVEIFGSHEDLWKMYGECATNTISLTINVKHSIRDSPSFGPYLNIERLHINGGTLKEIGDGKEATVGLNHLRPAVTDHKVRHLVISSSQTGKLKLASESLQFKNLESLTLQDMEFVGLSSSSINLENVRNFNLLNIGVDGQRASPAAIKWNFVNSPDIGCPTGTATFTIENLRQTRYFDANSVVSKGKECRGVVRKIVLRGGDSLPVIPAKIFQDLLSQDEIDELTSDPIECCHTESSWLFKSVAKDTRLNAQCSDLGGDISSYPGTKRDDDCKKRNVTPIYLIAIITIGSLALILTIFGSICFFYIIPRQKAIQARSHAESELNSSADNHVTEMDSNQTRVIAGPKRTRSRSKKKNRHIKPMAKLNLAAKDNSPTGKRGPQATILKVNSISDEEGHRKLASQVSDSPTVRTQATAAAGKEAKSGVFHTLA